MRFNGDLMRLSGNFIRIRGDSMRFPYELNGDIMGDSMGSTWDIDGVLVYILW